LLFSIYADQHPLAHSETQDNEDERHCVEITAKPPREKTREVTARIVKHESEEKRT
jgi:hypothetical protein